MSRDDRGPAERTLRPANDNPWYCLATLHGEQPIDGLDQSLAEKNRVAWRYWFGDITDGQRAELAKAFAKRVGDKPLSVPERSGAPDFSLTRFDRKVSFAGYQFLNTSAFSAAIFCEDVDFGAAQFQKGVDFSSTNFSAGANFQSTLFNAPVNFRTAQFCGSVNFQTATAYNADFTEANFTGASNFNSANFHGKTEAQSATFVTSADFVSTQFIGEVFFNGTSFAGNVDYTKATFADAVSFNNVKFQESVRFINAKFSGVTDFSAVHFAQRVPDFRGATMHEATEWHGVTWPKPPRNKSEAQTQVYAYERLKQEMERLKKHADEQRFFRRELRASRGLLRRFSGTWLINLIYQISSNYGVSVSRPLYWLTGIFVCGIAIFTNVPLCAGNAMPFRLAVRLSFANIFVFLNDKRELTAAPEMQSCLSNTTAAVSAVQSISGVMLLFLIGLVLRNRFRMK